MEASAAGGVSTATDDDDPDDEPQELFGTETMAELCARQGRLADAIAIYQRLLESESDLDRQERMAERLYELTRAGSRIAVAEPGKRRVTITPSAVPAATRGAPQPRTIPSPPPATHKLPMVVREPVRSGQVVYAEESDLIVLAPVNPGARLMADGNIHVYSTLRGSALAGVQGCGDARVFCLKLEAELIGINGHFVTFDDVPRDLLGKPAQVFLVRGSCVVKGL